MPTWSSFLTPAGIVDFPDDPEKQAALNALWSQRVSGFTDQAILGNPWQARYTDHQDYYVNPLTTDIPDDAAVANIAWAGIPRRITFYFPSYSVLEVRSLANTGRMTDGVTTFGKIPRNTCPGGDKTLIPFGPYGPRGWQDEYCEWSTTYDDLNKPVDDRKVLRIDFVCENPEYWQTLWAIDPQRVVDLYNNVLNYPDGTKKDDKNVHKVVTMSDLVLHSPLTKQPVIDPFTGRPSYNPLNVFNSGPESSPTSGGAIHLTATPNTLQTELGLAAGATVQRKPGAGGSDNTNTDWLICCSQYGQLHRNSDPHIGQEVNLVVSSGLKVSLANPPGLYLQTPVWPPAAWVRFPNNAPAGAKLEDYFRVVRGAEQMAGPGGKPIASNFYLHCVLEVPRSQGFCLSDIEIMATNAKGEGVFYPITGGAQIAELFKVQINAVAFSAPAPAPQPCVGSPLVAVPQPYQMLYADLWNASNATVIPNVVQMPMTLASNTVIVPPRARPGQSVDLVLTYAYGNDDYQPQIVFTNPDGSDCCDVTVTSVGAPQSVTYAVPGNSYPGGCLLVPLTVQISAEAKQAVLGLRMIPPGGETVPPIPAFLTIAND